MSSVVCRVTCAYKWPQIPVTWKVEVHLSWVFPFVLTVSCYWKRLTGVPQMALLFSQPFVFSSSSHIIQTEGHRECREPHIQIYWEHSQTKNTWPWVRAWCDSPNFKKRKKVENNWGVLEPSLWKHFFGHEAPLVTLYLQPSVDYYNHSVSQVHAVRVCKKHRSLIVLSCQKQTNSQSKANVLEHSVCRVPRVPLRGLQRFLGEIEVVVEILPSEWFLHESVLKPFTLEFNTLCLQFLRCSLESSVFIQTLPSP